MVAMRKKRAIFLDGKQLKLEEVEILYLEFLVNVGFFRSIGPNEFLTNDLASLDNPLNPCFISTPLPSTENQSSFGFTCTPNSASDAALQVSNYLAYTRSHISKPSHLLLLETSISILEYFLKRYTPEFLNLRKNSLAIASLGECDLDSGNPQVQVSAASSNLTEGSSFEEVMNDLTLSPHPVKGKMKRPRITKAKLTDEKIDNEQIMSTAIKWREWAIEKAPWLKTKSSNRKYYEELCKMGSEVDLNEQGIEALLEFIKHDAFWKNNAISPANLLTPSKNGLRKIDNILLQMRKKYVHQNPFHEIDSNSWDNPFD